MSRIRVYELAKEAGMSSKALAEKLIEQGYDIKGHSSTVDAEEAEQIRKSVLNTSNTELVEKRISDKKGTTVIRRRSKVIRRRPKAEPEEAPVDEVVEESPEEILAEVSEAEDVKEEKEEIIEEQAPKIAETEIDEKEVVSKEEVEKKPKKEKKSKKEPKAVKKAKEEKPPKARKGIAKVVGTIDIPIEEERRKPRVKKKSRRPSPVRSKRAPVASDIPGPVDETPGKGKKKGRRPGTQDDERKGKAKKTKKGRKKVKFTHFGSDYEHRYGRKGQRGRGRGKKKVAQPPSEMKASKKRIKVYETITVADLASRMRVKASEVIAKLMGLGVMATMNQALDVDTATLIATDFEYEIEQGVTEEIGIQQLQEQEEGGESISRSPVVTVMGHVDHGKTSILDAIRKTDVAEGEAGGITQHIGAYHVQSKAGDVTFVDTPGHAAFTEMRSRGAQITDLVILVVAADDGVMEQTREAIHHAQAAEVPIIVAVNKIDKDNADPDRVKRELAELDLAPEEWGGQTIYCETSAKKNIGISELMENMQLMAEMLELKADPQRKANGRVVEAKLDKGRGPVATVLVQQGTLKKGDHFVVGQYSGKVRAMLNDKNKPINEAGPSIPVEVQGLSGVPSAGDEFIVVTDEKMAKSVANVRSLKAREQGLGANTKISLDQLFEKMSEGDIQELRVVLRADVQGTLEAFAKAAEKLSTEEIKVRVLHEGTGTITESDILLASASEAIIIGFNVRPTTKVKELANKENVDVRSYDVIYHALDDIRKAMVGMLEPTFEEDVIGSAEVRDTFKVPRIGTIAGCAVVDGVIRRNAGVRVLREGVVIYTGKISSLKRFKDDAKEVGSGYECGIGVENFNDIKVGDSLEAFEMREIEATLVSEGD